MSKKDKKKNPKQNNGIYIIHPWEESVCTSSWECREWVQRGTQGPDVYWLTLMDKDRGWIKGWWCFDRCHHNRKISSTRQSTFDRFNLIFLFLQMHNNNTTILQLCHSTCSFLSESISLFLYIHTHMTARCWQLGKVYNIFTIKVLIFTGGEEYKPE